MTDAQIGEARQRGMKVYSKVDTFASWQFGTVPYLPFPYQWHARYEALEKYGVNGTLESWSSGYSPSFIAELRAWSCWSDAPPLEELLGAIAARDFGTGGKEMVLKAWDHFSRAIRLVPDTGPNMGTNNAVGQSSLLSGTSRPDHDVQVFLDRSRQVDGVFRRRDQSLLAFHRFPHGLLPRFHQPDEQGRSFTPEASTGVQGGQGDAGSCRSF